MADEEGIYFDYEINNRLRGVSRMASLEIILEKATKKYSEKEKEALASGFIAVGMGDAYSYEKNTYSIKELLLLVRTL